MSERKILIFKNARIGFRNFSGIEKEFNPKGKRNFVVFIDDQQIIDNLINDGWNIKFLKPRNEDDEPQAYLQVAVSFDVNPPKFIQMIGDRRTFLKEDIIDFLDWAEFSNIDVSINPYHWEVAGKSGIKAYLKTFRFELEPDEFGDEQIFEAEVDFD